MRIIKLKAVLTGSINDNLRRLGYSATLRARLRKKLGLIRINEESKIITDFIKEGEWFEIVLEDSEIRHIKPYSFPIEFIYEDEDIAIINKPAGIAVINTRNHYGKSLENALAAIWGDFVYRPVNRLDKDTTGLMIIAKNQLAHSVLSKNEIQKKYLALCEGHLQGEGTIDKKIARSNDSIMLREISNNGQVAITKYKVIQNYSTYCLVELELKTGRTHQIRVHMSSIDHPLLMDGLYNKNAKEYEILDSGYKLTTQALHSYYLKFAHPISGKQMEFVNYPEYIK
ncbi:MAG: RluA family pseudouridine synthase [Christensenella sp.]|nr:RluA family pseudouridine synthase [Christensenella sp.]